MKKTATIKTMLSVLGLCGMIVAAGQPAYAANDSGRIDQPANLSPAQQLISVDQAKTIALQQVKGRVVHVELETEDGVLVYEVIVINEQNQPYEVEIDAVTGKVRKVEREDV
ncbi:PepSY domain-containing protein [Brevibacillus borstelensis]|uniref:PepSY domain-containing protein n=1 Tax=Brevibacillus borstelensis TaxID=45462 RepID=UPI0030BBED80